MKVFNIEARSDFAGWNRYNVFLTAVCTLPDGTTQYVAAENGGEHTHGSPLSLSTPTCESAEVHLYVVAREFPALPAVAASPPFDVQLIADGKATIYKADQYGGLSVKTLLPV